MDLLELQNNSDVQKMLMGRASYDEQVQFSDYILKINSRGKEQERVLLVTDKAMYNLSATDYSKCKRRIPYDLLDSVTMSEISDEFVLHIPDEYDYRLMSQRKRDVVDCIQQQYTKSIGRSLRVIFSNQIALKDEVTSKKVKRVRKKKGKGKTKEATQDSTNTVSTPSTIKINPNTRVGSSGGQSALHRRQTAGVRRVAGRVKRRMSLGWAGLGDQPKSPPEAQLPKFSIDHFTVLKVIGRGSMGKVLLVEEKQDAPTRTISGRGGSLKKMAVKVMSKEKVAQTQQMDHVMSESKILAQISGDMHPFIVNMIASFQNSTMLFMCMEFVEGGELYFHLRHERKFSNNRVRLYAAEIALSLEHLHARNIVFRDLKPENVMLDCEGHIKLIDFGFAKVLNKRDQQQWYGSSDSVDGSAGSDDRCNPISSATNLHEKTHTFCGTPEYQAPEIISGIGHGLAVDWWALGCLVHELVGEEPPYFCTESLNYLYEDILHAPLNLTEELEPETASFVTALLQRNPAER